MGPENQQTEEEFLPMNDREKSIYAWAKAARTKGSGLPPSRALRWIDELGDRLAAREASGAWTALIGSVRGCNHIERANDCPHCGEGTGE